MSMMKTSLTIILMCPRERFPLYKSLSRLVLCYKKDWATFLHLCHNCYLLPVTNYLITKLFVTDNFSACREYLAENRLSFPSAPRWVRHSYLSKGLRFIPYTCGSSAIKPLLSRPSSSLDLLSFRFIFANSTELEAAVEDEACTNTCHTPK